MDNDGFWLFVVYNGQVIIPTTAKVKAGFYLSVEPVEVVGKHDLPAIEQAVIRTIKRGNPVVPTPSREHYSKKGTLLEYAKASSRSEFERLASSWKFSRKNGTYYIVPYKPRQDSGSEEDTERTEAIMGDVPLEQVVRRLLDRALKAEQGE